VSVRSSGPQLSSKAQEFVAEAERIGVEFARPNAADVDEKSRFPTEAIEALREAKLLSVGVPEELGGGGCNVVEQAAIVTTLGRHCGATSMVLGMHFIKIETFVHHGFRKGVPEFADYLRSVVAEQRLVGSVTSEVGVGGNLRHSIAAVESDGPRFKLLKKSTCLSYGAQSDDLLITCRKGPDSAPSDQVVVLARKGDFQLDQTGEWNVMGMRGTVSPPFDVSMEGESWQILPESFGEIGALTMIPVTHILWSAIWLGVAEDAMSRARTVLQARARKTPDETPQAARKLAQVGGTLQLMRSLIENAALDWQRAHDAGDVDYLTSVGYTISILNVKLMASQLVVDVATGALDAIGFQGFANTGEGSVARHVRDSYSAALMISNERVVDANAALHMAYKGGATG
jgi:acyl-CoA dehydrogenase